MKLKLLRQLIRMSSYLFYSIFFQCLFMGLLMAKESEGQNNKSIKEINVSIVAQDQSLSKVLTQIEEQTGFQFNYHSHNISFKKVDISYKNASLNSVLEEIARQTGLGFKRVNNIIAVNNNYSDSTNENVTEEIKSLIQAVISGKVTSSDGGEPLPGVSILIKGTSTGTTTNTDGDYSLNALEGDILQFSFIGYKTQEVTVGTKTTLNISLEIDLEQLEEVIVVGYGTQENRKVSVAVGQVDSKDLEVTKRPVTNVQSALVGSMPGLIVEQSSGQLGSSINIKVRQASSLQERNALVLIDGFEGDINDINPNNISSVSILKDAAATAIYGARSANGVVLVTTKNPKRSEKLSLTYSLNFSRQTPAQTAQLSNSVEFIEFSNEATLNEALRNNPGLNPNDVDLPFSQEELQMARDGFYADTDWVEELYSENSGQMSHNLSINGGTENVGYFLNFGYLNQNGLVVGSDNFKRYNLRVNVDADVAKWLTIGTNTFLTVRNTENVPVLQTSAVGGRPFFPVQLEDGTFVDKGTSGGEPNPIARATSGSYDKDNRDAINAQLYAQLKPVENLVIEGRVSYVGSSVFREIWNTPYPYALLDMDLNQVGDVIPPLAADRNLTFNSTKQYILNSWFTARYKFDLDEKHFFNALAGVQTQDGESIGVEASRFNYILPTLQDLKLGQNINGFGNTSERGGNRSTLSYFGRFGYDYKGKYLAEFNLRVDGSSNFTQNNRWGFFPAFSLGWNIIEEPWMSNLDFIEVLKIRGSWGRNGDDGSIIAVERVNFNPSGSSLGGGVVPTINLGNAINPELKWETSTKTNIGLEMDLWKGKLQFTGDYFIDKRSDIITTLLTSVEGGLEGVRDNVYDAESWGWEFQLAHENTVGKVNYFANFNLSYYNSEITNTGGQSPLNVSQTNYQDVGLPIFGNWFGYETNGFFNNEEEFTDHVSAEGIPIDQSAVVSQGDNLGRYVGGYRYIDQITVDTDGDGIPDARDGVINADDRIVLKENTLDNYRFGFGLGVSYAGFRLSARLYGVLRGYQWWGNNNRLRAFSGETNSFVYQTDTWRPDNQDAIFPSATASNILPFETAVSDLIQQNDYIKLKNINLGYTFNKSMLEKLKVIEALDVYISVENLGVIWTNNPSFETGWDPELGGNGNFSYPLPLTTSFGANITF